jgi:uncharacterized protein (TIGR01777 family)
MPVFDAKTTIDVPAVHSSRWHARPGSELRLSPPWGRIGIVPFARFEHEQSFEEAGTGRSAVIDHVDYQLPFGAAGELLCGAPTRRALARWFRYRGTVAAGDLARHAPYFARPPLRVAITGASGLLGQQLAAFFTAGGHEVLRLVRRRKPGEGEISWDPASGRIDHEALEEMDAVVHLAGENIAARWTEERKAEIARSRVSGTKLLAEALPVLRTRPKVFVAASAIGYYGDRGQERVDETAKPGSGFLADVVSAWEKAVRPAAEAGIRTASLRFGVVLTSRGGAVAKMRLPFLLGVGGPIGGGHQGFSWIALDDAIYAIHHVIRHEDLRGPINVVAPGALPQRELASALGRTLHRPARIPVPEIAVRKLFGQMGEESLLASQFVEPEILRRSGFAWSAATLDEALAR